MSKNVPRTGKKARPKTAVKGKRFLCAKCRKRSPKPVKTPAPWYCPDCRKEKDALAETPDPFVTLPAPTPLRRTAIISCVIDSSQFHVVCDACSLIEIADPGTSDQIAWLHCHGYVRRPANPNDPHVTAFYLIPATHVIRITYAGRVMVGDQRAARGRPTVYSPTTSPPDSALPLSQVQEIIAWFQATDRDQEPFLYDNYVREVSHRFEGALARIKAVHNFDFGDEFEVAICKTLRIMLPEKYAICRGYVVSDLGEKAGDDIIIYDRMRFPTLRALETDDYSRKEHVPIEAVYAYIEAKHSICIEGNGGTSFQKALAQVARVKMLCDQRKSVSGQASRETGWPEIRNPVVGAIIARNVRVTANTDVTDDPDDIQRRIHNAKAEALLFPDFCVFGKNNISIPVDPGDGQQQPFVASPFFLCNQSKMIHCTVDGVGFGVGLSFLLWALDWIQLDKMPWRAILEDCIPPGSQMRNGGCRLPT